MRRLALAFAAVVVSAALVATAVTFAADGGGGTTIEHDGDRVTLAAAPGQAVSGQTDLDPGTTLQIQIESTDASNPFLVRNETTVADDGSFATTVDVDDVAAGATGNLTVHHDGTALAAEDVTVVACDDCPTETADDGATGAEPSGTTLDGDVDIDAGPAQEVTGETDLDPGTELQISLQSTNASSPFLVRNETTVADDGSFATTMDLRSISPGSNATLAVRHDGTTLAERSVSVGECTDACAEKTPVGGYELGLERSIVDGRQNESIEIPVHLADADEATLRVGDDDVNYRITATARDGNGDDRVTVVLNASATGSETPTVTAGDAADTVSIGNETAVDGPISSADYDLTLYRGDSTDDEPADVGALVLRGS